MPPEFQTYRTVVEKYASTPAAEIAHEKLAALYEDLKRYEQAAQTWESLATNFPRNRRDGQWRAAGAVPRKLKDAERARAAYAPRARRVAPLFGRAGAAALDPEPGTKNQDQGLRAWDRITARLRRSVPEEDE